MTECDKIVTLILEADEDETIKDILGPEYQEPLPQPAQGEVFRHDRWADVVVGDRHYCVSYLTPVAFYDPGSGVVRTERNWSTSTIRHIKMWLDHVGFDVSHEKWPEVQARFPKTMPQEQLVERFKQDALRVKWTKRQARKLDNLPYNKIRTGLRGGREDRVDVNPYHEPPKEWDL
jgi:hypothetical protein